MSAEVPPDQPELPAEPKAARTLKAEAAAAKAHRKSLRPWYKKKRFLLPIGFFGLPLVIGMIAAAFGSSDKSANTANGDKPGSTASSSSSSKTSVAQESPRVNGTLTKGLLLSLGAPNGIDVPAASNVYCQREKDKVTVHITFVNTMQAHLTMTVEPSYTLENAGEHATGFTNQKTIGIDPGATREWVTKLGNPAGVSGTPNITECAPKLTAVELG